MNTISDLPTNEEGKIDLNATARNLLETLLNAVMAAMADEICEQNGVSRNGYRERKLTTCIGEVALQIPKLREGTFFPDDLISRWSRTDTALTATICEMWVNGVSTRKVEKVAEELGIERMEKSRVSRLCKTLDDEVDRLRLTDLSERPRPYLWIDATYLNCREDGAARSCAVVTAIAAGIDARRQVVAIDCIDTESYASWRDFLIDLRKRGLYGVELVISDEHAGLVRAAREVFIGAAHQRCIAHLERNVIDRAAKKKLGSAAIAAIKAAFEEDDPGLVRAGYDRACEIYRKYDKSGAELLEQAKEEALAYLAFPKIHYRWIRTNNVSERMNREIKRRADQVQVFPSRESVIRLIGAQCCEQNDAWLCEKWFIDRKSFEEPLRNERCATQPEAVEIERVASKVERAFEKEIKAA